MTTAMLRAEGVTRVLPGEVPVTLVQDISLDVHSGEFLAITGPSGSGKSSLLYLLGLLDTVTAGRIVLQGTDTSQFDEQTLADTRLSTLGFVFQFHFLLPEFSSFDNVLLPMRRLNRISPGEARDRAAGLLNDLGLGEHMRKFPHQLSGGQRQRVAIARALANDPAVILADEPTGNLDSASTKVVQELLRSLTRGQERAVVVVTHDPEFASGADRVVKVVDGRLTASD